MGFSEADARQFQENVRRNATKKPERAAKAPQLAPISPQEDNIYAGMNKTEERYARKLEDLQSLGTILKWGFEKINFRLAHKTTYTPDFMVTYPDCIEFVEVKGHLFSKDGIKFKMAREMFPQFKWIMLSWDGKKKEWMPRLSRKQ
jgi:hypothetical protein